MKTLYTLLFVMLVAFTASAQENIFSQPFESTTTSNSVLTWGAEWSVGTEGSGTTLNYYLSNANGNAVTTTVTLTVNASQFNNIKLSWSERKTGTNTNKIVSRVVSYKVGEGNTVTLPSASITNSTWSTVPEISLAGANYNDNIQITWTITADPGGDRYAMDNITITGLKPTLSFDPTQVYIGVKLTELGNAEYTLEGTNLTSDITITAPSKFKVSLSTTGHENSITVPVSSSGNISQTIYVLYEGSDVAATYKGNVIHTSNGITANLPIEAQTSNEQPAPQPVELASFNGQTANGATKLIWTTASETNNEKFVVERSQDGRNFNAIGEVSGSGNSATRRSYNFTDEQPGNGTNYYRLRQVDFDGTEAFSNVVALRVATTEATVYPTVATREVRINLPDATHSRTINVTDATGRPVATFTNTTEREIKLSLESLRSGMYFVRITDGQNQQVQRFIKQ